MEEEAQVERQKTFGAIARSKGGEEGVSIQRKIGREILTVSTGAIARQADGSVWVTYRDSTVLVAACGWGIWAAARGSRPLRVVGGALVVNGIIGLFWPPMHLREVVAAGGATLTDTLHVVWMAGTGLLMLLAMGFGAAALGRRFRIYSIVSMVALLACGAMTSRAVPRMEANLPTPWTGAWERINIGAWLLWVVVLAIVLLRRPPLAVRRAPT